MRFEWDAAKAAASLLKHGVGVDEATTVLGDIQQMSGGSSVWTVRLTDTAAEDFKSSSGSQPYLGNAAEAERSTARVEWT